MARGHKEVLTSQVGCRRGTPWETPTASSLVVAMSVEELRLFIQIPAKISLETQTVCLPQILGKQIMSSILHRSILLLGFASPFHH